MKANQIQTYSKKILPFAIVCGFVLLFTYGLSMTAGDLSFAAEMGEGGIRSWVAMTQNSGGKYISAFLGAICIDVPVLRHLILTVMLSSVLIALLHFCGADRPYSYYSIAVLGLFPGAGIFAYAFSNITGAVSVMIPAFLTVLYLFTVSDLFTYKGRKKSWKIPFLFLSGFCIQFFSESISIALVILSFIFLFGLVRKYGFSYHLGAHAFGSLLGFILTLVISGGKTYFVKSFYTMLDQLSFALDHLFVENLLLICLLTLGCLILIQPIRSDRSPNCNKTLVLLLVPTTLFVFLNLVGAPLKSFPNLYIYLTVLKVAGVVAYFYGILRTLQHYISKDRIIGRARYSLMTVSVFIPVYAFSGNACPNMLYIAHLCLVAVTALIFLYGFHRHSRLDKAIRKPVTAVAVLAFLVLIYVTGINGYYSYAVNNHVYESLAQGSTVITLPEAPYKDRIPTTTLDQLSDYYDFPSYGSVEITYVPFGQWDWDAYYKNHNVPVIEDPESESVKDEWTIELEEEDEE